MRDAAILTGSVLTGAALAATGHYETSLLWAEMVGLFLPVTLAGFALWFGLEEPPFHAYGFVPASAAMSLAPIAALPFGLDAAHQVSWYLGLAYGALCLAAFVALLTGLLDVVADRSYRNHTTPALTDTRSAK